jgi:hypothetical protein
MPLLHKIVGLELFDVRIILAGTIVKTKPDLFFLSILKQLKHNEYEIAEN